MKLLNINSEPAGESLNLVDSNLGYSILIALLVLKLMIFIKVKKYLDILKSDNVVALDELGRNF